MQRIKIKENEFESYDKDNYRTISIKEKSYIFLNGIDKSLKNDVSKKWKASDNLKFKFTKWYIDEKGIKICPYCGKNFIAYFCNESYKINYKGFKKGDCKSSKIISGFDIEHFFPKGLGKYAQLAKNLYNWHLSCTICNQRLKGNKDPLEHTSSNKQIFNPYFGWIYNNKTKININNCTFDERITFYGNENNDLKKRKQIFNTLHGDFFRLGEIYLKDEETFNIFNFIQDKRTKIKDERLKFKKSFKSDEELKNYFFKNYYPQSEQDILKFSNGKLKKDLIENLKLD